MATVDVYLLGVVDSTATPYMEYASTTTIKNYLLIGKNLQQNQAPFDLTFAVADLRFKGSEAHKRKLEALIHKHFPC